MTQIIEKYEKWGKNGLKNQIRDRAKVWLCISFTIVRNQAILTRARVEGEKPERVFNTINSIV